MPETSNGFDTLEEMICIRQIEFSGQLGIGAAKWLLHRRKQTLTQIVEAVQAMSVTDPDMVLMSDILTALRIQGLLRKRQPVDYAQAEADVDSLTLPEMVQVFSRVKPFEFEPKNSPAGKVESPATDASTGPASSTT